MNDNGWNSWNRQLEQAHADYLQKAYERLREYSEQINAMMDRDEGHDPPMREIKREGNVVYIGRLA